MFTSEMESMLAMLMLIPTMTGGPEGTEEKLLLRGEKKTTRQRNSDQLAFASSPSKVKRSHFRESAIDVAALFILHIPFIYGR